MKTLVELCGKVFLVCIIIHQKDVQKVFKQILNIR